MATNYWQQALGDVQSGRRQDFTPLTGNTPSFQSWLSPQRQSYYDALSGATKSRISSGEENYGEEERYIDFADAQRLRTMAEAAGLQYGGHQQSAESDYLAKSGLFSVPSYEGSGGFVENLMHNAPIIAAGAFGTAGALGGLDQFAAGSMGGVPPSSYWNMGAEAVTSDAPSAMAGTMGDTVNYAGSTGPGVTQAGTDWMLNPAVDGGGFAGMNTKDWLKLGGAVAPGVLGYFGAGKQADAYKDVASYNASLGEPARARNEASYQPGFDLFSQPGYGDAFNRAAEISARQWSTKGNPAGNPTLQAGIMNDVWAQNYLPALANYRGQNMQAGGLGLNTSGLAQLGGAQTAGGQYDAIGYGLGRALNPQPTAEEILQLVIGGMPAGRR